MKKLLFNLVLAAMLITSASPPANAATGYTEAIPPVYDEVGVFSEGLAVACGGGGYGFIDKTGKVIIPLIYDYALPFSEGLAAVTLDGKWGCVDASGNIVVSPGYDYVNPFSEGLSAVYLDDMCGFIDKSGNIAVPLEYDEDLNGFSEGFAAVSRDGKWGFVDKTGAVTVPLEYDEVHDYREGLAAVGKYDENAGEFKWGYVNAAGVEVIAPRYGYVRDFHEGVAVVAEADSEVWDYSYGYIDKTGRELVAPSFFEATDFSYGGALATGLSASARSVETVCAIGADGGKSTLDTDSGKFNNVFYTAAYDGIFLFTLGSLESKSLAVDKAGKIIAEHTYIGPFNGGYSPVVDYSRGGEFLSCGFVTAQGDYTPLYYEDVSVEASEGMLGVCKNGKWGFIALGGTVTPSPALPALSAAKPSTQAVTIDGVAVDPVRYNIDGVNYFKLRDLAALLAATAARFDVGYDSGYITVTTGKPYTAVEGDLTAKAVSEMSAVLSTDKIILDGVPTDIAAYKIDGANYFQLRDLGAKLGFYVGYDEASRTMTVTTR